MKDTIEVKIKLLKAYHAAPPIQQRILQVCALLFFPLSHADLFTIIKKINLPLDQKNPQKRTHIEMTAYLDKLKKAQLLDKRYNCHPLIIHDIATLAASTDNPDRQNNINAIETFVHTANTLQVTEFGHAPKIIDKCSVHVALYLNNDLFFDNIKTRILKYPVFFIDILSACIQPIDIDLEWVKQRAPIIQLYLMCAKFSFAYADSRFTVYNPQDWFEYLKSAPTFPILKHNPYLAAKLQQIYFCLGFFDEMKQLSQRCPDSPFLQNNLMGIQSFLNNDMAGAIKHYETSLKSFKKEFKEPNPQLWYRFNHVHNGLYLLALILKGETTKSHRVLALFHSADIDYAYMSAFRAFQELALGNIEGAKECFQKSKEFQEKLSIKNSMMLNLLHLWLLFLLLEDWPAKLLSEMITHFAFYQKQQYPLFAHFIAEVLLQKMSSEAEQHPYREFLTHHSPYANFHLLNLFTVKPAWEYTIDKLSALILNKPETVQSSERRLVWLIQPDSIEITAYEQKKLKKNNVWSPGRQISLKRLIEEEEYFDYLSAQDKKIIRHITRAQHGWYYHPTYEWDKINALKALCAHPLLFDARNNNVSIQLTRGEPQLQITENEQGYHLSLSHHHHSPVFFLEKLSPNHYQLIELTPEIVHISELITPKGLSIPFAAKEKINQIIHYIGDSLTIHADVKEDNIPLVESDSTCLIHLMPINDGFQLEFFVRPFRTHGMYCHIGKGQQTLIATVQHAEGAYREKTVRDFEKEQANLSHLLTQCPLLESAMAETEDGVFNDLETCLEILTALENYKNEYPLIIEWPKGQHLKLKQTVSSAHLSLSIKGSQQWFEYEGEIVLDDQKTLDIKRLLDLVEQSNGRFIRLADGEFLALTTHFKKQLDHLKKVSEGNKIFHLGAGALTSLAEESAHLEVDQAWENHQQKLTAMREYQPIIPSTLQAELRPYQIEGIQYLSRLTHWEIGVCLADDMGLGKTLQTIAVLLEKGKSGSSIVVAPTSVCFTWKEELAKFSPTLSSYLLSQANNREDMIAALGPMDILIVSYGLLQTAGDALLKKHWEIAVLDEAQAIKNAQTKRWQYATRLRSKGRIALTGTPIENHLGELWSIFRFLNPGLLGSQKHFQNRYLLPIERQDFSAKHALKSLVSPYILRRLKSEVLQELPAKTEQSILIEPSPDERAFYEAVRRQALERIERLNTADQATKRFSILAEITRLRQACCHSSLVDDQIDIPSSKTRTFLELVKNLIDNKHKVLVFSQYVRYLQHIKNTLDAEQIFYQYLDGSTPAKTRQTAIRDFQAGEGDVFLISLKAGGTGLNLTAADYVIILDPWWNPSVEDQAAARAHRMGQERPVTVYRLIMQNSMEEKILALHQNKRDLANDLLSGSDISGKLNEDELMALMLNT